MTSPPLRAILVEDSPVQSAALARLLEADGDIVVVERARDAAAAVEEVARHRPDVVTMDLDIPRGGGQHAIERIMAETPTPILVLSGIIAGDDAPPAVQALAAGAVDALPKPHAWTDRDALELRRQVRRVSSVPVVRRRAIRSPARAGAKAPRRAETGPVVGIAASTGGPAALAALLPGLLGVAAPILVVQHIHPTFVPGFATWLANASGARAMLADEGAKLEAGTIYVAPGEVHLKLGPDRTVTLDREPPHLHRPSADELFRSLAEHAGRAGIGVVLTGMGDDGAEGLVALRRAGGRALGQDQASSAVFGMARAARDAGAAQELLPLDRLAEAIRQAVDEAPP